ncbi:MAG: 2-phosphosulfolactate phosphatase [Gemmatimonadota bacterium]|nr:2-phosphosulfolactate phosphatase [Gemmatimonadota bacterium]
MTGPSAGGPLDIDVAWLSTEPDGPPGRGSTVVVIDAIRATTSIATALSAGAARVIPVADVDEARRIAADEGALLCGERGGLPPEGFDLGNSPGAYTPGRVAGRTLVFTTSNGTAAMRRALSRGPSMLLLASFRNLAAVASATLAARRFADGGQGVTVVCSGRAGRVSMDDAWCAGHLVARLVDTVGAAGLTDGARAALELTRRLGDPTPAGLRETWAGRALAAVGLEGDLEVCALVDDLDVAPIWVAGAFVTGVEEDG